MGSTGDPNRLSPARRAAGRWRPRAQARGAQGRSGRAAGRLPALPDLYLAQYRSLFRLAVLLTGDADVTEPWC